MTSIDPKEVEEDRQRILALANENFNGEAEVHRRFDPGTHGSHEAADRTFIMIENIESYILNHPTVAMNKECFRMVHEAHQLLYEVYNNIACADFPDEKEAK